ncbi:MAG: hypothetical protein V3T05_11555 [Myxococcota bacterium]
MRQWRSPFIVAAIAAGAIASPVHGAEPAPPGSAPVEATEAEPASFELNTRLHTRYVGGRRWDPGVGIWEGKSNFAIVDARLGVDAKPVDWLRGQVEVDVVGSNINIRDGFAELRATKWLRFRMGQFKKPFGRLQLMSKRRLPLWRRGLTNKRIVRTFGFGDRHPGFMLHGRVGELGYAVGLFNPLNAASSPSDIARDGAARVTYRLSKSIRLGASGSLRYDDVDYNMLKPEDPRPREDKWAAGIDGRLRAGILDLVAETIWAQDFATSAGPEHLGAVVYAVLRFELDDDIELRPVLKGEILDHNLYKTGDIAWSVTAGLNVHLRKWLRVMVQGEYLRSQVRVVGSTKPEQLLVVLVAFDQSLELRQ